MKIAIFTDTYLPDINGVVTSVELERKMLEELGHDVYVVTVYPGALKVLTEGKIIRLPGVELKKLYGYSMASPVHFIFMEELRNMNFDVIHAETEFGVGIFASICAASFNIPLVRTNHTTFEDYTHYVNFINSNLVDQTLKKVVALLEKAYSDRCFRVIAPSQKTKDMLVRYGIKPQIDVIPTGIELDKFRIYSREKVEELRTSYGFTKDNRVLVYVGRIAKEKSLDRVISAFAKVDNPNLRLLVVGDGPDLMELKELSSSLGMEERIVFAGKQPFDQIAEFYHLADGFISASTTETQGMTYIEALACGLIVMAAYDKVLEDLIVSGVNGFFFKDDESLKTTIEAFGQMDFEKLKEMSKAAVKTAESYDCRYFGEALDRLFKEVVDDHKHSFFITKTVLKDDYVLLHLKDGSDEIYKLYVSLDDYYASGFRSASKVTLTKFKELKSKEVFLMAYRGCLHKLSLRDRTEKQIRDYLANRYGMDQEGIGSIVERLKSKGLLDDRVYTLSRLNYLEFSGLSRKMMVKKLRLDGVSDEIIAECVPVDSDEEFTRAFRRAEKLKNGSSRRSLKAKKDYIFNRLQAEGFSVDIARKCVELCDFSEDILNESSLLKQEALKAYRHYSRKYSGFDLRNRVFKSLITKGFSYEEIYCVINEMEF